MTSQDGHRPVKDRPGQTVTPSGRGLLVAEATTTRAISRSTTFGMLALPLAVVAVVIMLVIPLPSFVLDVLITLNISASMLVLLTAMHVKRPLEFSVFPTLL